MTPTSEQAKAELERRASNKVRKAQGEKPVNVAASEVTKARNDQLREWAKD